MADTAREIIRRLLGTVKPKYTDPDEIVAVVKAINEARAYLATPEPAADGPAVPDGREPVSVAAQPTDAALLELMPETMRDEFSYAAKVCSDATGGQVMPGIFRVTMNTAALEYARAVLTRYGHQPPQPIPLSERLSHQIHCLPAQTLPLPEAT